MITDTIVGWLFDLLELILGLFPAWTAPSWASDGSISCSDHYACVVGEWLGRFDHWIDVGLLSTALGVLSGALVLGAGVRVALWLYGLIPAKGT
ncbi:MAG: hypothetical protein IT198_16335 [Acidimicrobiia bacterium]|nr:hypothetical protein [Acidimicrobiia bacterium]